MVNEHAFRPASVTLGRILWPVGIGILGLLSAKKEMPGNLSTVELWLFFSAWFVWGAAIGAAIHGLGTATNKAVRIACCTIACGLLSGAIGLYDHEYLRPISFAAGGGLFGLLAGYVVDPLLSRHREVGMRAKISAVVVIVVTLLLAIAYVTRNWIETSQ